MLQIYTNPGDKDLLLFRITTVVCLLTQMRPAGLHSQLILHIFKFFYY